MAKSIKEKYFEDFEESEYNNAIAQLWEEHCKYPSSKPWPPPLKDVEKEIEDRKRPSDSR